MKKMGALLGLVMVLQTTSAFAAVADMWKLASGLVSPSYITKADGTKVPVNPSEEVLLQLGFETYSHYGYSEQRQIKSKEVIPATEDEPAIIKVEIETNTERQCSDLQGDSMLIGSVGPSTAYPRFAVKPGQYILFVDGLLFGLIEVSETEVKAAVSESYKQEAILSLEAKTKEIFGDLAGKKVNGHECSVEIKQVGEDLFFDYLFPSRQETLENGDILIRKEVKGTVKVKNLRSSSHCESGGRDATTRKMIYGISWGMELNGEDSSEFKININPDGQMSYEFKTSGGKRCYQYGVNEKSGS